MNLNLNRLPNCRQKDCEGQLLPFEDTSKEGVAYLKGWACNKCDFNIMCNMGKLAKTKIDDYGVTR